MAPGIPARVGRYEILGRLASGGMAEVFLGRLEGPHGFERPVVIKRILPHLALERGVVEMFLDEARLIANLRHPNLIHVDELARDGDDLFIAMEYLEGESLAGLCRRLAMRDEHIEFAVAAHLIAEACAGLHAAHEATSSIGRRLEIVHRDISPQNVFVTYSGTVHVIDFGIATTADRISRTEAGVVRGKFGYLAPEQIRGVALDRRADVFALGVTLTELVSGRRLYSRPSQAATMMAILNEPVPRLSSLRPDSPEELEVVCSRAMAKSRAARFQTAAEMRRDLLAFVRGRSDRDPAESLATLMRECFADRVAEKADLLRRVRQGDAVQRLPPAEVDIDVDLETLATEVPTSGSAVSRVLATAQPEARGGARWALAGSAMVAVLVAVAATIRLWPSASQVREAAVSPPSADVKAVPTATQAPPSSSGTPAVAPGPSTSNVGDAGRRPAAASARPQPGRSARPNPTRQPSTPAAVPTMW